MSKFLRSAVIPASVLVLVACASGRVIPKENGEYVAIGTSHSEAGAIDVAVDEGKATCKKQGKHFVMVSQNGQYRGMDKNARGVVDAVGVFTGQPTWGATRNHDDNKVEIVFKCK